MGVTRGDCVSNSMITPAGVIRPTSRLLVVEPDAAAGTRGDQGALAAFFVGSPGDVEARGLFDDARATR